MSTLHAKNITKYYGGVLALDNVSLSFQSGKVNALLGKNGAGKSTLIKIISGAISATKGTLMLDDQVLKINNTQDAMKNGIVTVYQELSLLPNISVAENIFMGKLPRRHGLIDWQKMYNEADALLQKMGVTLSSRMLVERLSMWQRQMVEIVKAMSNHPKVLMLDEPTSSLSKNETQHLFDFVNALKEKDIVIIYITHKLHELKFVADSCFVIRDGHYIGNIKMNENALPKVVEMMFGETETQTMPDDIRARDTVCLETKNLCSGSSYNNISLTVHDGEIVGIAGMLGSGRTELMKSIFGAYPISSGSIFLHGKKIKVKSPAYMKAQGIAYVPEDRRHEGLVLDGTIQSNLCMASYEDLNHHGFISNAAERNYSQKMIDSLEIKTTGMLDVTSSLSGGSQQKVVVGKWLNTKPTLLMFDEPSRGIDINAKQEIYKIIWNEAKCGVGCIVVSSELEELLEVCHRIIVMQNGEFKGEYNPKDLTVQQLYGLCIGETENEE